MSIRKASAPSTNNAKDKAILVAQERVKAFIGLSPHHAYCFITSDPAFGGVAVSQAIFSAWAVPSKGNPDFLHYPKESFVIEDAHKLREWSSTNPVCQNFKICSIETHSLTEESQNALLKLFESTPNNIFFFLIVPSKEIFLPTLYSRMAVSSLDTEKEEEGIPVKEFLASSVAERSELLKEIIEERDKAKAQTFLDLLEEELYNHKKELEKIRSDAKELNTFVHSLTKIKKANLDQRSSLKLLMEHVIYFTPCINQKKSP
ncbi:MAG: hypothetical protein ACQEP6_03045 [Patescibacteria group bacterium]